MLHDQFDNRRNSLNLIRLALATLVLVAHSWPLSGHGHAPMVGGVDFGAFAVAGFFALSGYLITGSRLQRSGWVFAWHRFLRIYPGYWAALTVTALLFAPIAAWVTEERYSLRDALSYVVANASILQQQPVIADTLASVPYVVPDEGVLLGPWNGSAWTLPYEVGCYAMVGVLMAVPFARSSRATSTAAFGLATAAALLAAQLGTPRPVQLATELGATFLAGVVLRLWAHQVPVRGSLFAAAVGAVTILLLLGQFRVLGPLPLAYGLMWLGIRLPLHRLGRRNDYSYGVYIYGFPVQQLLAAGGAGRLGVPFFFVLSVVAVALPAVASWRLVERPALRMRHWIGDKRTGYVNLEAGTPAQTQDAPVIRRSVGDVGNAGVYGRTGASSSAGALPGRGPGHV